MAEGDEAFAAAELEGAALRFASAMRGQGAGREMKAVKQAREALYLAANDYGRVSMLGDEPVAPRRKAK